MNLDRLREIIALVEESGVSEIEIEEDGLRIAVRKDPPQMAVAAAPPITVPVTAPPHRPNQKRLRQASTRAPGRKSTPRS